MNQFCHCSFPIRRACTHTHTHTHTDACTQTKSYAWWKKYIYLKHVHIFENVVNICIINDHHYFASFTVSTRDPPANNQNAFCYYPTRILSTAPAPQSVHHYCADINSITALWSCQVEGTNGLKFVCINCVRRLVVIHTRSGNRTTLE